MHLRAAIVTAAIACGLGSMPLAPARAGEAIGAGAARLDFDIPAQPLAGALEQYAARTNRPTLFQGEMVAGRASTAVRGSYLPEPALHRLLQGTGLIVESVSGGPSDALVLKEAGMSVPAAGVDSGYGARVQASVWQMLCADARTAPGDYRALLRFAVNDAGQVGDARLLQTTGSAARDAAVLAALRRVRLETAPPPQMAQPLTMIVLPRAPGSSSPRCAVQDR